MQKSRGPLSLKLQRDALCVIARIFAGRCSNVGMMEFNKFLRSSEKHPKSTLFLEGYWRRRDEAPAAGAIGSSRRLHATGDRFTRWRLVLAGTPPSGFCQKEARS